MGREEKGGKGREEVGREGKGGEGPERLGMEGLGDGGAEEGERDTKGWEGRQTDRLGQGWR